MMSPHSLLQHRYVVAPTNTSNTETPKDYENIESPSIASNTPTDTDITLLVTLAPPTPTARFKERNKLQLTLTLHEGEDFVPSKSSTIIAGGTEGSKGRHGTAPSSFTESGREVSKDDNYIFMSPPPCAKESGQAKEQP